MTKKKLCINWADIALIIIVVVAIVGVFFRHGIIEHVNENRATYTYEAAYIRESADTPVAEGVGTNIYYASTGKLLGEVTKVDGEKGSFVFEGTYDEERGHFVGGNIYIAPGQTIEINTKTGTSSIKIMTIEKCPE